MTLMILSVAMPNQETRPTSFNHTFFTPNGNKRIEEVIDRVSRSGLGPVINIEDQVGA